MKIKDIFNRFFSPSGMKQKLLSGSIILSLGSGSEQFFRLVRNMILTRLLVPEAFSVVAIILAVQMFFDAFTDVGIREAVIQNPKSDDPVYLNGVFWFSFCRVSVLYLAGFIAAPFIARFYNNPELTLMLRISFLSIIFTGLISIRSLLLVKKMQYIRWMLIDFGAKILGVVITVIMALFMKNSWALVLGFVTEYLLSFLLSYIICPFVPGFKVDKGKFKELTAFTRRMAGLPVLTFLFMRADVFFLGKMVTPVALGLYSMVVALARTPTAMLLKIGGSLIIPLFSEIQHDKERRSAVMFKLFRLTVLGLMPFIFFVCICSRELLVLIYTPEYGSIAAAFALLFIAYMLQVISQPFVGLYIGIGQPQLHRLFTMLRAIMVVAFLYPLILLWGTTGAGLAVLLAMGLALVLQVINVRKYASLQLKDYCSSLLQSLFYSLPLLLCWLILQFLPLEQTILRLATGLVSLLLAYGALFLTQIRTGRFSIKPSL